mmetsp:Transcript_37654/g.106394  ORF Transcript_37654/g.106394 Transcript_37654/m.106394 type:complete len:361 (+) Transcript_37654:591-1673(+)
MSRTPTPPTDRSSTGTVSCPPSPPLPEPPPASTVVRLPSVVPSPPAVPTEVVLSLVLSPSLPPPLPPSGPPPETEPLSPPATPPPEVPSSPPPPGGEPEPEPGLGLRPEPEPEPPSPPLPAGEPEPVEPEPAPDAGGAPLAPWSSPLPPAVEPSPVVEPPSAPLPGGVADPGGDCPPTGFPVLDPVPPVPPRGVSSLVSPPLPPPEEAPGPKPTSGGALARHLLASGPHTSKSLAESLHFPRTFPELSLVTTSPSMHSGERAAAQHSGWHSDVPGSWFCAESKSPQPLNSFSRQPYCMQSVPFGPMLFLYKLKPGRYSSLRAQTLENTALWQSSPQATSCSTRSPGFVFPQACFTSLAHL